MPTSSWSSWSTTSTRSSWENSLPQQKPSALARQADPMRAHLPGSTIFFRSVLSLLLYRKRQRQARSHESPPLGSMSFWMSKGWWEMVDGLLADGCSDWWLCLQIQGILTSETRCLNCETVTSKDEEFCDLSIDVDQNTSVTSCLRFCQIPADCCLIDSQIIVLNVFKCWAGTSLLPRLCAPTTSSSATPAAPIRFS